MRRYLLIVLAILISVVSTAQATEQTLRIGGLSVTVWSQENAGNPRPTVIFSHGFHGCATQSRFLMEGLADAGYLVIAPNHRDATCAGGEATWMGRPDLPFQQPEGWNDTTYRDRADDIRRLLDALRSDDRWRTQIDWDRLALAGHSLGGYTVLGLAGAWPSWKLAGIKAVLALSPYTKPFDSHHTLATLAVPVMYQGGTRDVGITPELHKSMGSYDQTSRPKYYLELDGAGHFAWTNVNTESHRSIVAYSLAFLDHYVKNEPAGGLLTQKMSDVAIYRYASELGESAANNDGSRAPRRARGRFFFSR